MDPLTFGVLRGGFFFASGRGLGFINMKATLSPWGCHSRWYYHKGPEEGSWLRC